MSRAKYVFEFMFTPHTELVDLTMKKLPQFAGAQAGVRAQRNQLALLYASEFVVSADVLLALLFAPLELLELLEFALDVETDDADEVLDAEADDVVATVVDVEDIPVTLELTFVVGTYVPMLEMPVELL